LCGKPFPTARGKPGFCLCLAWVGAVHRVLCYRDIPDQEALLRCAPVSYRANHTEAPRRRVIRYGFFRNSGLQGVAQTMPPLAYPVAQPSSPTACILAPGVKECLLAGLPATRIAAVPMSSVTGPTKIEPPAASLPPAGNRTKIDGHLPVVLFSTLDKPPPTMPYRKGRFSVGPPSVASLKGLETAPLQTLFLSASDPTRMKHTPLRCFTSKALRQEGKVGENEKGTIHQAGTTHRHATPRTTNRELSRISSDPQQKAKMPPLAHAHRWTVGFGPFPHRCFHIRAFEIRKGVETCGQRTTS